MTIDRSDPVHFTPASRRERHDGWTVERQRTFIQALAETGSVSDAARVTGVSARSAYRLRTDPRAAAFAAAWDRALKIAIGSLTAIAFDRAIHGGRRETWKNGELVRETRAPSDRMLAYLLGQFERNRHPHYRPIDAFAQQHVAHSVGKLPAELDALTELPGDILYLGLGPIDGSGPVGAE